MHDILILLFVGISVGQSKPEFNFFMKPLVTALKNLEYGISLNIHGQIKDNIKFYVINGVYDKPARAAVLMMISSNGFYGCLICLQPGESIATEKGMLTFEL